LASSQLVVPAVVVVVQAVVVVLVAPVVVVVVPAVVVVREVPTGVPPPAPTVVGVEELAGLASSMSTSRSA